jgi:hemerythrin-like domain-containing protein
VGLPKRASRGLQAGAVSLCSMTQTDIPTLEDIDSAFEALVFPDFSDDLDQLEPAGGGADLTGYLAIHQAMRIANAQLVRGIGTAGVADPERAAALARWFRGYSDELRTHHHIEDDIVFPELLARVPDYAAYSGSLADDHRELDGMIDAIREALATWARHTTESDAARDARYTALDLAVELRDFLEQHLAIEDADVLPMMFRNFTFEEYAELEKQAGKAITIRQAMFTAPWYMATVDPETAARTWREAPITLKIIHLLARRSYAKLVSAAFGVRA